MSAETERGMLDLLLSRYNTERQGTIAVQRTACREPLRHDARRLSRWDRIHGYYAQCQACGEPAPCSLHQPRAAALEVAA